MRLGLGLGLGFEVGVRVRVWDRVGVRGNWGWPRPGARPPYISLSLPVSPHPELVLTREHEDRLHMGDMGRWREMEGDVGIGRCMEM